MYPSLPLYVSTAQTTLQGTSVMNVCPDSTKKEDCFLMTQISVEVRETMVLQIETSLLVV